MTNTSDIERLPLCAFQPLLDEAVHQADPTGIRVAAVPMIRRGLRTGWWQVERNGERALAYASVPDATSTQDLHDRVAQDAALAFAIRDLRRQGFPEGAAG